MGTRGPKPYVRGGYCRNGHLLDDANVYMEGERVRCRTCDNERKGRLGPSKPRVKLELGKSCPHCDDHHILTKENTYQYPNNGKLVCKQRRIRSSRKHQGYSGNLDDPLQTWNRDKVKCPRGHDYAYRKDGSRICPECHRLSARACLYGMTIEELEDFLKQNEEKCWICKTEENLHIDHDHLTKVNRGLLCQNCNLMLGHAKDSIDILEKAIEYLKK